MRRNSLRFLLLCIIVLFVGVLAGYVFAGNFSPVNQPVTVLGPTPNATATRDAATYSAQAVATIKAIKGRTLDEDPWVFSAGEESGGGDTISNTEKGLFLSISDPGSKVWTINEVDLPSDVDVSVTAQGLPPDPCEAWDYSLDIRQQINGSDSVPFYDFQIFRNLIWRFGWYDPDHGDSRTIAAGKLDPDFDMQKPNTLRVVAVGKHFDLYINGKQVTSADDPAAVLSPKNRVGVAIETCTKTASALFTNLVVKTPQ